jgi:hypothetical protein
MTAPWWLPAWFGLIGLGWVLRDRRERIYQWLLAFLDDPDLPALMPVVDRSNVRQLPRRPFDFDRDGGDAA